MALSPGRSQRQSLSTLITDSCGIEQRTPCDVLFQNLQLPLDRKLARI